MQIEGDAGTLERWEDGSVKPAVESKTAHKFKVKLQDPAVVNAFYRLHDRAPGRGMDSSMLIMSKAMGKTGKKLAMAAPRNTSVPYTAGELKNQDLSLDNVQAQCCRNGRECRSDIRSQGVSTLGENTRPHKTQLYTS